MILQSLNDYIKAQQRVEESVLLKHFRLTESALQPMIALLIKRGKIHKTINERGDALPPEIFYSYSDSVQIPALSVV